MKALRSVLLATGVLAGISLAPRGGHAAATISPGKVRAYASTDAVDLSTDPTVGVMINKASHKYVVVVEATVNAYLGANSGTVFIYPSVNGLSMDNGSGEGAFDTICDSRCTISGTWFLDIDAAEAAHPGTFFAGPKHTPLPLDIQLRGSGLSGQGFMILVARKENKLR